MAATDAFRIHQPELEDLEAARDAWRDGRLRHSLAAGATFWRVLRADNGAQALKHAEECFPSDGRNRFSPVMASTAIVPSAYAGATAEISLWEVVLRGVRHGGQKRVMTKEVVSRFLIETRTARPFEMIDIRRPAISNVVAPGKRAPDLTAAWPQAYGVTRAWAQSLHDLCADADGLLYESHQLGGDCIVLLQSHDVKVFETVGEAEPLNQSPVREMLANEARRVGAVVDFGDVGDG